jgi:hypothetical protein
MTLVPVSPSRAAHHAECRFGTGFFRVVLREGNWRYCQSESEVERVCALLPAESIVRVQRDGYCLDGDAAMGDARTPDVVDAEAWLALPIADAMRELGLRSEADYARAYGMIEAAVVTRNNREAQSGVHASIVIKRRGAKVADANC